MKNLKTHFFLLIYIFMFLFSPDVFPIGTMHVLFAFSFIVLITFLRGEVKAILKQSGMYVYILIMLLFIGYGLLIISISNTSVKEIYKALLMTLEIPTCILLIFAVAKKHNLTLRNIFLTVIASGLLQAVFAIGTFLFPGFRYRLIELMYKNSGDVVLYAQLNDFRRAFGFAQNMFFDFTVIMAILSIICFVLAIDSAKPLLYIMGALFLCISLINGRTGPILLVVCMVIFILSRLIRSTNRIVRSIIGIFVIGTIGTILLVPILKAYSPKTYDWVMMGITDILYLLKGEAQGSMEVLFKEDMFWSLPKGLKLLFGEGYQIFKGKFAQTDVGYVNDVWFTGLLGTAIYYAAPIYVLVTAVMATKNRSVKSMMWLFGVSLLMANVKGTIISASMTLKIIYLIGFSAILFSESKSAEHNIEEILVKI